MATFIIRSPSLVKTPDPTPPVVRYHNKTLPADAAPIRDPVEDPTVNYAGKKLPQDGRAPNLIPANTSNNPGLVVIGGVTLPPDVLIFVNGKKDLAISRILDGVSVVQHVGREPYDIEFEATLRTSPDNGTTYIFPQDALDTIWNNVWLPNVIQTVKNTYLNNLGIQEIIIESVHPVTIRGNKNVPFRIKAIENVPGQTLIVSP